MVVRKFLVTALCVAGFLGVAATSHAALDTSGVKLIVNGTSDVIVTFRGSDATDSDLLYLDSPGGPIFLFDNHLSAVGSTVNLGSYAPGTELIFRLDNVTEGTSFFTGPGFRNPDGVVHAGVDFSSIYAPEVYVGFEDLIAGDFDYNDTNYSFTNLRDPNVVPEPGVIAFGVLAAGSVMGLVARKRKKA